MVIASLPALNTDVEDRKNLAIENVVQGQRGSSHSSKNGPGCGAPEAEPICIKHSLQWQNNRNRCFTLSRLRLARNGLPHGTHDPEFVARIVLPFQTANLAPSKSGKRGDADDGTSGVRKQLQHHQHFSQRIGVSFAIFGRIRNGGFSDRVRAFQVSLLDGKTKNRREQRAEMVQGASLQFGVRTANFCQYLVRLRSSKLTKPEVPAAGLELRTAFL